MKRVTSETRIGDHTVRYRIRIDDNPSEAGYDAGVRLIKFLETLSTSPDLLNCGYSKPQKLNVYHTGSGWVVEAEATLQEG